MTSKITVKKLRKEGNLYIFSKVYLLLLCLRFLLNNIVNSPKQLKINSINCTFLAKIINQVSKILNNIKQY